MCCVVIVGAGHAGFQAAAALRQEGFEGRIVLIGDESPLPYQRPPLSKAYLLGKIGADTLCFRPETYFADQRIELVRGRAEAIARREQRVRLGSGAAIAYDHLVLALGARNRSLAVPGSNLDGVAGLRSLADADALGTRLKHARRVAVIGAGFIGLEFAAAARALGAEVEVIELGDRPMARGLSHEMSRFFAQALAADGIRCRFREAVAAIHGGSGGVCGLQTLSGERLAADLVLVGIDVVPNVELAAAAGLAIENGILTDAALLTSDPAISAIGDCAAFPSPWTGRLARLESVQNATDHARTVAARLRGKPARYEAVPWFWTEQGALKLQMAGLAEGSDGTVTIGRVEERAFSVLCFRGERLVAVDSLNRPADHMVARRLLARSAALPSPAEAAADGFDLRSWAAAHK
jgi:3-phenylpropionate/trans-cinnamate dioxygenase ferredoxin reductase subunit